MDNEATRDEIKRIIFNSKEITESWLAYQLGISPQALNYQLNEAKKFDHTLHQRIMAIFKKRGIISNNSEECARLNNRVLEFTSIVCQHISMFTLEVSKDIQDEHINMNERLRLKMMIEGMRTNLNKQLDQVEAFLED